VGSEMCIRDRGYLVTRNVDFRHKTGRYEVDILCKKGKLSPLTVEVKNILSEVIVAPMAYDSPSQLHKQIENEFRTGNLVGMIPILFAPFVDSNFYLCCDLYKGLFCQTYLQFLPPGEENLKDRVKEKLAFGNLRIVSTAPDNVVRWIRRIEKMWNDRYVDL